jgi:hypothetical protein
MQLLTIVLIYFVALAQASGSSGIIPLSITSPREHETWVIGETKLVVWYVTHSRLGPISDVQLLTHATDHPCWSRTGKLMGFQPVHSAKSYKATPKGARS